MSACLPAAVLNLALALVLAGCGPRPTDQAAAGRAAGAGGRPAGAATQVRRSTPWSSPSGRAASGAAIASATATPLPTASPLPTRTRRPTPYPTFAAQAFINVAGLNFRAGPGLRHQSLEVIGKATPLALAGRNEDGSWVVVRLPAEVNGWVASDYLTFTQAITVMVLPTVPTPSPPPATSRTPLPMDPAAPAVLSPPVVAQGDAVMVRLRQADLRQAQASLGEHVTDLFAVGPDTWAGFLPVAVDTSPGDYAVHLTMVTSSGDATTGELTLTVVAGRFLHENIGLTGDLKELINNGTRDAETARLATDVWAVDSPVMLWHGRWRFPYGGLVSSLFGVQRDYTGTDLKNWHTGLDFRGPSGAPVYAAARGRVALAERLPVRGNCVWLDHGWGLYSGYFHLSQIKVAVGQMVEQGQLIGHIGATGMVTGAHLHFEVRVHGVEVQPVLWLARDMGKVP